MNACLAKAWRRRVGCWTFGVALLTAAAQLHAQSTTGIYVNSNNNVGIGTTSPSTTLHVNGSGNQTITISSTSGTTNAARIIMQNTAQQWYWGIPSNATDGMYLYDGTHSLTQFSIAPASGNAFFNGNVGIGTTSPQSKLDVAGQVTIEGQGDNATALTVHGSTTGTSMIDLIQSWVGGTNTGTIKLYSGVPAGIGTVISGGNTTTFFNANGGNVGIGTSSPNARLEIRSYNSGTLQGVRLSSLDYGGFTELLDADTLNGKPGSFFHEFSIRLSTLNVEGVGSNPREFLHFGLSNWGDPNNANGSYVSFPTGNVGIGTNTPGYKLDVAGQVHATSFVSSTQTYADFVFKPGYKLPSLSDEEAAIKKDGHLPGIPSEAEAKARGIDLASMQVKLLQKIEELTLHQIEQEKRIEKLEDENAELREKLTK